MVLPEDCTAADCGEDPEPADASARLRSGTDGERVRLLSAAVLLHVRRERVPGKPEYR